jgi:hypothetical protein
MFRLTANTGRRTSSIPSNSLTIRCSSSNCTSIRISKYITSRHRISTATAWVSRSVHLARTRMFGQAPRHQPLVPSLTRTHRARTINIPSNRTRTTTRMPHHRRQTSTRQLGTPTLDRIWHLLTRTRRHRMQTGRLPCCRRCNPVLAAADTRLGDTRDRRKGIGHEGHRDACEGIYPLTTGVDQRTDAVKELPPVYFYQTTGLDPDRNWNGRVSKPACIGSGNWKWLYDSQKQKDQN